MARGLNKEILRYTNKIIKEVKKNNGKLPIIIGIRLNNFTEIVIAEREFKKGDVASTYCSTTWDAYDEVIYLFIYRNRDEIGTPINIENYKGEINHEMTHTFLKKYKKETIDKTEDIVINHLLSNNIMYDNSSNIKGNLYWAYYFNKEEIQCELQNFAAKFNSKQCNLDDIKNSTSYLNYLCMYEDYFLFKQPPSKEIMLQIGDFANLAFFNNKHYSSEKAYEKFLDLCLKKLLYYKNKLMRLEEDYLKRIKSKNRKSIFNDEYVIEQIKIRKQYGNN